ncbi:MAG: phosphatidate cytidylyltransferase [Deltaproteobacteria bacterium]|nr:phosphatidate cytidylyltransferase [Deltaproteobacteria bacterium]
MIRVITTFILAAGVLSAIWFLPLFPFQILLLIAIGIGLMEYSKMVFAEKSTRFFTVFLGLLVAFLMTWSSSKELILAGLVASVFLSFLWGMKHHQQMPETTHHVGLMVLGICYLSLTLPFWSWLKAEGRVWVMLCLFPACLTDTFGFLVGKSLGRYKLASIISPNKTWEGFFAGLIGGGIFGLWLASHLFLGQNFTSWPRLIVIGISVSVAAALGDLIESLIKRSVGVKDSSHLIPGHGGALDRLDALTFSAPLFYFLLKWNNLLS